MTQGPLVAALGKRRSAPRLVAAAVAAATTAANGLLELAAGGELRNRRRRDLHLLARVARVHALPCLTVLRRELSEAGEGDVVPALQRVGHRVQEGVDGLRRIPPRQVRLRGDLVYEL